jgi:hypothetical protein
MRGSDKRSGVFGWMKTVVDLRKTRFRGLAKAHLAFIFAAAAYKLERIPKLIGAAS